MFQMFQKVSGIVIFHYLAVAGKFEFSVCYSYNAAGKAIKREDHLLELKVIAIVLQVQ